MNKNMKKIMAAVLLISAGQGLAMDLVIRAVGAGVAGMVAGASFYEAKKHDALAKKGSHWATVKVIPSKSVFYNDTEILEYRNVKTSKHNRNICAVAATGLSSFTVLLWLSK